MFQHVIKMWKYRRRCYNIWVVVCSGKQFALGATRCIWTCFYEIDEHPHAYQVSALTLHKYNSFCFLC